jgi:hypothetical protein
MKLCPSCGVEKPLSEFRDTRAGNKRTRCLKCDNAASVDSRYRRFYGIEREDWNQMFAEQEGCCAICGKHQSEQKKRLEVDHCHETGHVRALLCTNCNTALGKFYDDPELLYRAADYLTITKRGFQDIPPSNVA